MTNEELKQGLLDIIKTNKKKAKRNMIMALFGVVVGIAGAIIIVKTIGWLPLLGITLLLWSDNISNSISNKRDK
jgi:hypothetical protein